MNYKLFKVCLSQSEIDSVKTPFTAFDNIENKRPELREYHIFKRLIDEKHTDDLDMWGVFSNRADDKLRYSSDVIATDVDANPGYDVYIFNHARIVNSIMNNVWEQGEIHHRGITAVTKYALNKAGYDSDIIDSMMNENTCCYCSYFVATKQFWAGYIQFLDKVKYHLDNSLSDELNAMYKSKTRYSRDNSLTLFPFIVERLFSTYLLMNYSSLKIYHKPYDYSVYKKSCGEAYKLFESMNGIKNIAMRLRNKELYDEWNKMRVVLVQSSLDPLNMD